MPLFFHIPHLMTLFGPKPWCQNRLRHPDVILPLTFLQGCMSAEDCGKGRYCLYDTRNSKCLPCKAIDVVSEPNLPLCEHLLHSVWFKMHYFLGLCHFPPHIHTVASRQLARSLRLHCSVSASVIGVCCLWTLCPWKDSMCQGQMRALLFFSSALSKYV